MRTVWSAFFGACLIAATSGCQSWSQLGQGIPAGSRVAPPGTGSYQVPSQYYNGAKTSSTTPSSPGQSMMAENPRPNVSRDLVATQPPIARTSGQPVGGPPQVTSAAWQPPSIDQVRSSVNGAASNALQQAGNRANEVVQASTSRAAAALGRFTDPANDFDAAPPSLSASRSISDSPSAEPPPLNWQAPR